MGRAFPIRSDCTVPSVAAIEGSLVSSCTVDVPPDPIYQFPIFQTPLPNPPSYNYGCYGPTIFVSKRFNQTSPNLTGTVAYPNFAETGNCEPEFFFNIDFPASNCPDISTSGKITKLSPNQSPTLKFTVTKHSDTCEFDFKLNIGIPGAPCQSTSLKLDFDDLGVIAVGDGDIIDAVVDMTLDEDVSTDDCKVTTFTLTAITQGYQLNVPPANLATQKNSNDLGLQLCCIDFTVVKDITSFLLIPGGGPGGTDLLQLNYDIGHVVLPTVDLSDGPPGDTIILACGTEGGPVVTNVTIDDSACAPCGKAITVTKSNITIELPPAQTSVVTVDSEIPCCGTIQVIDGETLQLVGGGPSSCAYHLQYDVHNLTLPQTSLASDTAASVGTLMDGAVNVSVGVEATGSPCACGLIFRNKIASLSTGCDDRDVVYMYSATCSAGHIVMFTKTMHFKKGLLFSVA